MYYPVWFGGEDGSFYYGGRFWTPFHSEETIWESVKEWVTYSPERRIVIHEVPTEPVPPHLLSEYPELPFFHYPAQG